ncbi:MAG: hypothetical protein KatS3mg108_2760 [Isosphaeraceae bacterium]|nr:MAG: hypothetical protein KatS3mg108_2760 [Isosphaeraceae bacterium]
MRFTETLGPVRLRIEGLTHVITPSPDAFPRLGPGTKVGPVFIHKVEGALPRVWFTNQVLYADSELHAAQILKAIEPNALRQIVVEDPTRPLPETDPTPAQGHAQITHEQPDYLVLEVHADRPGYLFIADTYDPGWSATLDGSPTPIHPADICFRAIAIPPGSHRVELRYQPAGWRLGLALSGLGLASLLALVRTRRSPPCLGPDHGPSPWPGRWPLALAALLTAVILASIPSFDAGQLSTQKRWEQSWHRFTWGAGIEAIGSAVTR